jgi:transposase
MPSRIEAGMATHYMARELVALGHVVKQVPPAFAKPFRQGHKNDFREAYAIAEAVQRPSPSLAIAICACSSSKVPALFSFIQRAGRSIALDGGSRLQLGACIVTF